MSIVESLRRLFDPAGHREVEEERRIVREQPTRDDEGAPPPLHQCRVCDYRGPEPAFCPSCLAETMRPVPPER